MCGCWVLLLCINIVKCVSLMTKNYECTYWMELFIELNWTNDTGILVTVH